MIAAPIEHIALDERGVAVIRGTGVKVADIAVDGEVWGLSPAQILENYPHLTLSQIHAALAYYYDHRSETESYLAQQTREYEQLRASSPNPVSREEFLRRRARTEDTPPPG